MSEQILAKQLIEPSELEEHGVFRNYIRDLILGANDGLVSVFALVVGITAGGLNRNGILLAGIASLVAGAISMGIGEYISTKSQEQVYDAEIELERFHIKNHLDHEIAELYEFYTAKGFNGELLDEVVHTIASDEDVLLREMMMAEFGVLEEARRSPVFATIVIGISFALGSLPPIFAILLLTDTSSKLTVIMMVTIFSGVALFLIGAIKAYVVRTSIVFSALENLCLGFGGGVITFIIGIVVDSLI